MERYQQKYRKAWESEPSFKKWIRPSKDPSKVLCIYCKSEINAKHFDLVRHNVTKKHKKCMEPFNDISLSQPQISFTPGVPTEKQRSQAMIALFTAVHTPFQSMHHLGEMCCKVFSDSKAANINLHRTKCSNIITNVLAPHFIDELLDDLKNSYFSLILDAGLY